MTQRKGKILFIGRYAGFDGGVERYEHTAALLLRRNGYKVYCAYQEEGREFENFSVAFRKMLPLEEVLSGSVEYSLIAVHKLSEPELLDRLLHKFKEKLVLFVHDHDPYCPRSYYYIPFGRRNCQRAYHPLVCSACAMVSNPRSWPNGVSGKLKHVLSFAKNLHRYREFPKVVVLSEFMRQNLLRNGFSESKIQLLSPYVES
ncbi:MAG: glycosyltransferase family 4 protein, partial [Lentisphaerae bacterium]|nr:glycosyltransferase family 4 protein [Lentisphaerota bacterium]